MIIIAAIAYGGYKYGLPWVKAQGAFGTGPEIVAAGPEADCVVTAESAIAVWSDGVFRFVNPPIDQVQWDSFRSEVEGGISAARSSCSGCRSQTCDAAIDAVAQLDSLVSDMDSAARSGGPPRSDLVRSQESIDLAIAEARRLLRASEQ